MLGSPRHSRLLCSQYLLNVQENATEISNVQAPAIVQRRPSHRPQSRRLFSDFGYDAGGYLDFGTVYGFVESFSIRTWALKTPGLISPDRPTTRRSAAEGQVMIRTITSTIYPAP
jgi:hypothetical protein